MILKPTLPEGVAVLTLSNSNSYLTYEIPDGMDWAVFQLDTDTSWTAAAVVQAYGGLTQTRQYAFSIPATYTAVGVQTAITVTGLKYLRLQVSTLAAGTDTIMPTLNVGKDNA